MPVGQFSIAAIQLAGIICEGVLYGSYLVTSWFCARALLFTGGKYGARLVRMHEVRWFLIIISAMFFMICTWDMATGILHLFNAFIKSEDPTVEFKKTTGWINIARLLNQSLIILLGDFVGIYRCWIVYERRWLVITPSLILYLGALATVIRVMDIAVTSRPDETFTLTFCPWVATMFSIHAVQNILTSGMLVWRIWCMGRQIEKNTIYPGNHKATHPRPIQRLMQSIAESGAVYTTTVFAVFLASALGSNVIYLAVGISLQTAGIAFNVVIICSIGRNHGELSARVADSENGPTIPVFQHAERDASVE